MKVLTLPLSRSEDAGSEGGLNIVRRRRARVVLPLDEGPDNPIMNVFWDSGPWEVERLLVADIEVIASVWGHDKDGRSWRTSERRR